MRSCVLITGGAGFVGSNLAIFLKESYPPTRVIALDNLKRRGSELALQRLREYNIDFIHGDIRNREDLVFADENISLIIECSAEPSILAGYDGSPRYVLDTNLAGSINCFELARLHKADVIFLSTSRVYPIEKLSALNYEEDDTRFVLSENQPFAGASDRGISTKFPLNGYRSLYGATKLASELILQEYISMYGIRGVINRCGVIAGPWQMGKVDQGVFSLWILNHYFKRELRYIGFGGSGKQVRDLLHIQDLLELVTLEIERMDELNGKVYNVGGGIQMSLSLLETTRLCQEITNSKIDIGHVEHIRQADIPIYVSDNEEVSLDTGWHPIRCPKEVLIDIFEWIKKNEGDVEKALL